MVGPPDTTTHTTHTTAHAADLRRPGPRGCGPQPPSRQATGTDVDRPAQSRDRCREVGVEVCTGDAGPVAVDIVGCRCCHTPPHPGKVDTDPPASPVVVWRLPADPVVLGDVASDLTAAAMQIRLHRNRQIPIPGQPDPRTAGSEGRGDLGRFDHEA